MGFWVVFFFPKPSSSSESLSPPNKPFLFFVFSGILCVWIGPSSYNFWGINDGFIVYLDWTFLFPTIPSSSSELLLRKLVFFVIGLLYCFVSIIGASITGYFTEFLFVFLPKPKPSSSSSSKSPFLLVVFLFGFTFEPNPKPVSSSSSFPKSEGFFF